MSTPEPRLCTRWEILEEAVEEGVGAEERSEGVLGGDGLLGRDVHDRGAHLLHGLDRSGPAQKRVRGAHG
jgi:hypothetical protein